jgi:hypothetical protein
MKRYAVIFEESAQADVRESYDWGRGANTRHNNGFANCAQRFRNN